MYIWLGNSKQLLSYFGWHFDIRYIPWNVFSQNFCEFFLFQIIVVKLSEFTLEIRGEEKALSICSPSYLSRNQKPPGNINRMNDEGTTSLKGYIFQRTFWYETSSCCPWSIGDISFVSRSNKNKLFSMAEMDFCTTNFLSSGEKG